MRPVCAEGQQKVRRRIPDSMPRLLPPFRAFLGHHSQTPSPIQAQCFALLSSQDIEKHRDPAGLIHWVWFGREDKSGILLQSSS